MAEAKAAFFVGFGRANKLGFKIKVGGDPGYDDGLQKTYRCERADEVDVLSDPSNREYLKAMRIALASF